MSTVTLHNSSTDSDELITRAVISRSTDNTVRLWDAAKGAPVQTLKGHSGMVMSGAFSPDVKVVSTLIKLPPSGNTNQAPNAIIVG